MSRRGGNQRIPRPPLAKTGRPSPWAHLTPEERTSTLDDVRAVCAALPEPRRHLLRVPGARAAAVLMPFFEKDGRLQVLLTKRPEHMASHQGEIAFPGGKRDPDDVTLADTALRETEEEVGVPRSEVEVLGELDPYVTLSTRFAIVPVIGVLAAPPDYRPDPAEVEAVLEVPVAELLADGVHREERWGLGPVERPVHFFELVGETVWGATAGMLYRFLTRLTTGRSDPTRSI